MMQKLRDPYRLLFFALLVLNVLPLWCYRYFPSQDGPDHLASALILKEYNAPDSVRYREFYTINAHPDPNWAGHLLLVALMCLCPPLVAEKVLLTGYVILLPLSVRFALRSIRPGAETLATLAFPFVGNLFFHMGFYNFCYSLALYFFVVGYWLRHRDDLGLRTGLVLGLLGLVLYFCHLVTLAAACLAIGVMATWLALRDWTAWRKGGRVGPNPLLPALWARGGKAVLALLPTLPLALLFLGRQGVATAAYVAPVPRAPMLLKLEALVSYASAEVLVSLGLAVVFLAGVVYVFLARLRVAKGDPFDGLLLVAVAYIVVVFAAPEGMSGGLFIPQRLSLFPYFVLILWLGAQPPGRFFQRGLAAAGAVTALLFLGLHWERYAVFNDYLAEYASAAPHIPRQATVLPLAFSHTGRDAQGRPLSVRVSPFRHAGGLLGVESGAVDLTNYEGDTGYFPLLFRPELNPIALISRDRSNPDRGLSGLPPQVDFLSYPERSGQTVDYVMLWELGDDLRSNPATLSILAQLKQGYGDPIYQSPGGRVQMYRRNGLRDEGR
jgi:hypothetical protein